MRQTTLDEFACKKKFVCERCQRLFTSVRALNIHISKVHAGEKLPPLYVGEGILDVESEGRFVNLKIRIKRSLWDDIKKVALSERIKPEEAIIASLVNLTVYGAKIEEKPEYVL
ncbi:MAG: hypothetical protein QXV85_10465 [Candidatus Bathyarchaeia archaeon]